MCGGVLEVSSESYHKGINMEPSLVAIICFACLLFLIVVGVPIWACLGLCGFIGLAVIIGDVGAAVTAAATTAYAIVASFAFSVIPMFILMGYFALHSGIGQEVYSAVLNWLGKVPGCLAIATTFGSGGFAMATGSSLATAATFTKLALPEMERYGYDRRLSLGCIAASGTFAALIPPSGVMVIFAVFTEVSLGKLLIAGLFPGFLTVITYVLLIVLRVQVFHESAPPREGEVSLKEKLVSISGVGPLTLVVMAMLGGLYFGVFTPSEAGGVGAFTTFLICLARRRVNKEVLYGALGSTVELCAAIFLLITGAIIFGKLMAAARIPYMLADFLIGLGLPCVAIIIIILVVYVILGTFLDAPAMMALTLPVLFPVVVKLGFDGILFGILVVKMIEIGFITPPLGLNVYVVYGAVPENIKNVKLEDIFLGALPFLACDVLVVALLLLFPSIALWLPSMMY